VVAVQADMQAPLVLVLAGLQRTQVPLAHISVDWQSMQVPSVLHIVAD
jgi:hypothetical protein